MIWLDIDLRGVPVLVRIPGGARGFSGVCHVMSHGRASDVCFIGVYLTDIHLMIKHLIGMHFVNRHLRVVHFID
jgi:hypothetical protein